MTARKHATAVNTATLDLRVAAKATRTEIDRLVAMAGKGTLDSYNSDSSTGGSQGRWETPAPRPPLDPPPRRPLLPPGNPPRTTQLGGETQETPGEADPLQMTPQVKSENPKPSERPISPREGPLRAPTHVTAPTEIPSFNPRVPPPQALHRHTQDYNSLISVLSKQNQQGQGNQCQTPGFKFEE